MTTTRKWAEFASSPPPRSGRRMYVSLNDKGIIVINRRTFTALGEPEAVSLLYDIDNLTIGIKPSGLLMPNAFPIAQRGGTGTHVIWAMSFMKFHQIHPMSTIRFLKPEMENDILVLDLNLTARTTQMSRKGWRKTKKKETKRGRIQFASKSLHQFFQQMRLTIVCQKTEKRMPTV